MKRRLATPDRHCTSTGPDVSAHLSLQLQSRDGVLSAALSHAILFGEVDGSAIDKMLGVSIDIVPFHGKFVVIGNFTADGKFVGLTLMPAVQQ